MAQRETFAKPFRLGIGNEITPEFTSVNEDVSSLPITKYRGEKGFVECVTNEVSNFIMEKMKIYNRFLECVVLPIGDAVMGTCYMSKVRKWRGLSKLSERELEDMQREGLNRMLSFAKARVPFYKDVDWKEDMDVFEGLRRFPIVTKVVINEKGDDFLSRKKKGLRKIFTGGSTGKMGRFYSTRKEISETQGLMTAVWEWYGYRIGMRMLQTGVMTKRGIVKRMKDLLLRTIYVPAFKISESDILGYLNKVRGKKGFVLMGYSSSLNRFAEVALKYGVDDVRFEVAVGWGDKMFDSYRHRIKSAFGCEMFDTYGCSEGVVVGAKKDSDYYYIFSPHVVVEIVDENGDEVADGEMGRVVVTRLDRWSMPMIRYDVGDWAVKLPRERYPENREYGFRLLESVVGRESDIIRMSDGGCMVVEVVETIFECEEGIDLFKVIQSEFDKISILYVANKELEKELKNRIEDRFVKYLGNRLTIDWKKVDSIRPMKSGKLQMVECLIK